MPVIMVHDLINPATGNTYKQDNLKLNHKFNVGDLVELESGVRLFVSSQYRDCDGSLLYELAADLKDNVWNLNGFPEYRLKLVSSD